MCCKCSLPHSHLNNVILYILLLKQILIGSTNSIERCLTVISLPDAAYVPSLLQDTMLRSAQVVSPLPHTDADAAWAPPHSQKVL